MNKLTIMRILDFITSVAGWFLIVSVGIATVATIALAIGMSFPMLSGVISLSAIVGGCSFVVIIAMGFIDSHLF